MRSPEVARMLKRQSLLDWSLQASLEPVFAPLHLRSQLLQDQQQHTTATQASMFNLSSILSNTDVKKQVRDFKRNISNTDTRFFADNFNMVSQEDSTALTHEAEDKLRRLLELEDFHSLSPSNETIMAVNDLFQWLMLNRLAHLAYQLINPLLDNIDTFFTNRQLTQIIFIIDQHGLESDLWRLIRVYKTKTMPLLVKRIVRLSQCESIQILKKFESSIIRSKDDLVSIIESISDGPVSCIKYQMFQMLRNVKLEDDIMRYLSSSEQNWKFLPPSIIPSLAFEQPKNDIKFYSQIIKVHENDEPDFQYRFYHHLSKAKRRHLAFRLWYELNYQKASILHKDISIGCDYPALELLHQYEIDSLRLSYLNPFMKIYSKDEISYIVSLLIFANSQFDKTDLKRVKLLYSYKLDHGFDITETDQLCYVQALIGLKDYDLILENFEKVMKSALKIPSLVDDLMIGFARSRQWKELEKLYINQFLNKDQYATVAQYNALFVSLSTRAGSVKFILKLWENYLKAGHQPTDQIICCIILSFLKSNAYREALQWFSVYSKYEIQLSSRSYSLLLNVLASTRDSNAVFQILDSLIAQNKDHTLKFKFMGSILKQFAKIGDFMSIERILLEYYPKFHMNINDHSRWILKAHFLSGRYSVIMKHFWSIENDSDIDYDLALLALQTSTRLRSSHEFRSVWERVYPLLQTQGKLDHKIYSYYMDYWVRNYGSFGVMDKLTNIKSVLNVNQLPIGIFNQMIFRLIKSQKPWLVEKILDLARNNGSPFNSKTYSLMVYSKIKNKFYTSHNDPSLARTVELIDQILNTKKQDRFGNIDLDLSPLIFKSVTTSLIDTGDVYEARRLFELYLETSTSNLLENIHVLGMELMLLGEEERWVEFDECYNKYVEILGKNMRESMMVTESHLSRGKQSIQRTEIFENKELSTQYDLTKIKQVNPRAKIPNWLKFSHSKIWTYRLKQLELGNSLNQMNTLVQKLNDDSKIIMTNQNLNETALVMSTHPELFDETIQFINKWILPGHILKKSYDRMRLRHGWGSASLVGIPRPTYGFIADIYYQIIENLNSTLNNVMTQEDKEAFLSMSSEFTVLNNLSVMNDSKDEAKRRGYQYQSKKDAFYRRRYRNRIATDKWNNQYRKLWTEFVQTSGKQYEQDLVQLKDKLNFLGAKLVTEIHGGRPRYEIDEIKSQREALKMQYLALLNELKDAKKLKLTAVKKPKSRKNTNTKKKPTV